MQLTLLAGTWQSPVVVGTWYCHVPTLMGYLEGYLDAIDPAAGKGGCCGSMPLPL